MTWPRNKQLYFALTSISHKSLCSSLHPTLFFWSRSGTWSVTKSPYYVRRYRPLLKTSRPTRPEPHRRSNTSIKKRQSSKPLKPLKTSCGQKMRRKPKQNDIYCANKCKFSPNRLITGGRKHNSWRAKSNCSSKSIFEDHLTQLSTKLGYLRRTLLIVFLLILHLPPPQILVLTYRSRPLHTPLTLPHQPQQTPPHRRTPSLTFHSTSHLRQQHPTPHQSLTKLVTLT